jgi:ABC-2 type transport system ATP-binding protein
MIEAHQLCKQFGSFEAVHNLTLTIQPGEVLALLGPNGAGKTTSVRMLSAILKPSCGWARVGGHDIVKEAQTVRKNVGLLTEYPGLYNRMNALEYLSFFGSLLGMDTLTSFQRAESLLKQFDLWEARTKRLDSYSKGMKQKIALVRALIHDPPILFLDEPTTAMDPQSARMVRDAIGELRAADRTILLTTHNLPEAEYLADRIAIVRRGQIIAEGTMDELMQQLMGDPLWEIQLAYPDPRLPTLLQDLVPLELVEADRVQYRCSEPYQLNPYILQRLMEKGLSITAMSEVQRNLEQVYLRIVGDEQAVPAPVTEQEQATQQPASINYQPELTVEEQSR